MSDYGIPENLLDQLLKLQPGQTLIFHFPSEDKARSVHRKLKLFSEKATEEGIIKNPISISKRSNPTGGVMVLVFCEAPITVELVEPDDTGEPILRDRFEVTF